MKHKYNINKIILISRTIIIIINDDDDDDGDDEYSRYERSRGFRTYGSRADREMYKDSGCLFVGNIPFDYGSKDIEELFSSVGPVQAVTIGEDKKTGRSKGHAFVQYQKAEDAIKAYEKFNNYQIENRSLRLDWDPGLQNKRDHFNMRPPRYIPPPLSPYYTSLIIITIIIIMINPIMA